MSFLQVLTTVTFLCFSSGPAIAPAAADSLQNQGTGVEARSFIQRLRDSLFHSVDSLGLMKPTDHYSLRGFGLAVSGHALETHAQVSATGDFDDGDDVTVAAHWALLIAGSAGWGNYRHQSDVCHAYQVLKRGGYLDEHIVVMIYDDIAQNYMNPKPGHIFNRPGGPDVYEGVKPDYTGADVNVANFLAVLAGDADAVKGIGSGKVIASGPADRVFVFFSDHGAPGVLGMPSGSFLFADDLIKTIKHKHSNNGYKEMVLYIEACESGSIFDGLLSSKMNVLAVTASNGDESSWGTYCPGMDLPEEEDIDTCLGDLFSVAWMENAENVDLTAETLQTQFFLVRLRTSDNFSYAMGSHVMQYGTLGIQRELAGDYEGMLNHGIVPSVSLTHGVKGGVNSVSQSRHHAVKQRDADLEPLRARYSRAQDAITRAKAKVELDTELGRRRALDMAVDRAAVRLLLLPETSQTLFISLGLSAVHASRTSTSSDNSLLAPAAAKAMVELVNAPLPGRPTVGMPVVDDWACLHAMVDEWGLSCGAPMDQYAMRHTRFLANLCNAGMEPRHLHAALQGSGCAVEQPVAAS